MLSQIRIPKAIPAKKIDGYKMPEDDSNLLSWDFVVEQMEGARHYWISTVSPAGRPHVVPLWGIWFENRVHFDGSPKTAWSQHLVRNPHIAVHLPDGNQVVILEGLARIIEDDELDDQKWQTLDTVYQSKYQVEEGSPYWAAQPTKVLAWDGADLQTMTRWIFD